MTDQLKKIVSEEVAKLPDEIKSAVDSCDWITITETIGKENSLPDDVIGKLQLEVLFVLTRMEYLDNLNSNIIENLSLEEKTAEKLVEELTVKVFRPIASKINRFVSNNFTYQKASWDKTIDFIISGGDYSCFI